MLDVGDGRQPERVKGKVQKLGVVINRAPAEEVVGMVSQQYDTAGARAPPIRAANGLSLIRVVAQHVANLLAPRMRESRGHESAHTFDGNSTQHKRLVKKHRGQQR